MLIECEVIDGELYVPLKTVGAIVESVWPFPTKDTPAIPWTAKQIQEYAKKQLEEAGRALW